MKLLVKLHEICSASRTLDEVFVKLKEIENPGHPYDFVEVWVPSRGWEWPKKSKTPCHKKKFKFLWQNWATVEDTCIPSTILRIRIPVRTCRTVGAKYIPRFFARSRSPPRSPTTRRITGARTGVSARTGNIVRIVQYWSQMQIPTVLGRWELWDREEWIPL
jgi:hypothetical protein